MMEISDKILLHTKKLAKYGFSENGTCTIYSYRNTEAASKKYEKFAAAAKKLVKAPGLTQDVIDGGFEGVPRYKHEIRGVETNKRGQPRKAPPALLIVLTSDDPELNGLARKHLGKPQRSFPLGKPLYDLHF